MAHDEVVSSSAEDDRSIVWLDIDNTLYSASTKISHEMGQRIHAYFVSMGIPVEEARSLHLQYYSKYGLALRGLVKHHNIDPLDFDSKCDGSLPLDTLLKPNPVTRKLLQDLDRTKTRVWGLTNAYKTHAWRVLRALELDDLVEDVFFCDYAIPNFSCKPEPEYYAVALNMAKIKDPSKCYFVDDNQKNVETAQQLGWGHCVHFLEAGLEVMEGGQTKVLTTGKGETITTVSELDQLRTVWPELFKSTG